MNLVPTSKMLFAFSRLPLVQHCLPVHITISLARLTIDPPCLLSSSSALLCGHVTSKINSFTQRDMRENTSTQSENSGSSEEQKINLRVVQITVGG